MPGSQTDETGAYDLFVIGAGSGGVRAARVASSLGARTAIAEERHFGGTCVNIGCVPKKLMVYASEFSASCQVAESFGWQIAGEPRHDWGRLIKAKNREIKRLNGIYRTMLGDSGVRVFEGSARIVGPTTIDIDGTVIKARNILVASGGQPFRPPMEGAELGMISDDMFFLERIPKRAAVVGGGYIAVEFAGILNGLGVETDLVYRGKRLLRNFDADLGEHLAPEMSERGVTLRLGADCVRLERHGHDQDTLALHLTDGTKMETDLVLFATGRRPNTGALGLDLLGVKLAPNGAICVDERYRSSVASIFAIGDATDRMNLTPVAINEGMALARHLFGEAGPALAYELIPSAVFSQPPIATCGLSEEEARKRFDHVQIYKTSFRPMSHAFLGDGARIFMKLVVGPDNRVVGAHMIGDHAAEIMQGIAVAMQSGATKEQFDRTVGIHPTSAEEFVTMREPVS